MNIPLEIYRKIILYGAIVPLHYTAYKTATIRPIFSNELNCNLTGTITLDEEEELTDLDLEYYQYLLSQ
tara:strand:- start:423 stop:629 length:207 start_codon:yes stop_codon:yes gene_type:complete